MPHQPRQFPGQIGDWSPGVPHSGVPTPLVDAADAGTYFPKNSRPRYNRPGMLDLVPQIKELWVTKRDSLLLNADSIVSQIQNKHKMQWMK